MISCKRATELISKSMDEPLTFSEKRSLVFHNFICESCEQFQRQLGKIRRALQAFASPQSAELHKLSAEKKEKIKQSICMHDD